MNFAMSTVKVELEYLSPEGFRYEQASNSDFTLTSLTELSGDSSQLELPHSRSFPDGKPNFTLIFFNILTYICTSLMSDMEKVNLDVTYFVVV